MKEGAGWSTSGAGDDPQVPTYEEVNIGYFCPMCRVAGWLSIERSVACSRLLESERESVATSMEFTIPNPDHALARRR